MKPWLCMIQLSFEKLLISKIALQAVRIQPQLLESIRLAMANQFCYKQGLIFSRCYFVRTKEYPLEEGFVEFKIKIFAYWYVCARLSIFSIDEWIPMMGKQNCDELFKSKEFRLVKLNSPK